ncbi:MAG: hypothetical protein KAH93_03335 [Candidatus Aenigmarchaeota archaeon]|nr:hypothetical protein [Candidatus Aenigmarchaeota archaeon]
MSVPVTGSSVADNYRDQMMYSNNPDVLHLTEGSYNFEKSMKRVLEPHFGKHVDVILDDRIYLSSFPDRPKLVGFEDGFFTLNDEGYRLDADAISAIMLGEGEKHRTPIYLRTYGGEDKVPVYHILDTLGDTTDKTTNVDLNKE